MISVGSWPKQVCCANAGLHEAVLQRAAKLSSSMAGSVGLLCMTLPRRLPPPLFFALRQLDRTE